MEGILPILFCYSSGLVPGLCSEMLLTDGLTAGPLQVLTANGPQPWDDAGAGRGTGPIGSFPLVQGGRGLDCDLMLEACKKEETFLSKWSSGNRREVSL